jgi:uncharacterized membrane protein
MQQSDLWNDDEEVQNRWLRISLPFLIIGVYLCIVYLLFPATVFLLLFGMMVAYIVPPAGRETVIPVGILLGIPWWLIAFTLAFLDFVGGLFMAWNFPLVLRTPYLGPWIQRFMVVGRTYLARRPWLEKLYFIGLVLFVSLPFEGSGSVVGTIIGRMLGMTKMEVLACIALGGILGSFGIALGADYIRTLFLVDFWLGFSLVAFLLIGLALFVMLKSYTRNREANL